MSSNKAHIPNTKTLDLDEKKIKKDNRNSDKATAFKTGMPLTEREPVKYIFYTLKEGDSISSIGNFYTSFLRSQNLVYSIESSKAYLDAIKKYNSLHNDFVCYVGQTLKLPIYINNEALEPFVFQGIKPELKPDYKKRIVSIGIKSGDNLISICNKLYKNDWQKWKLIFDLNKTLKNSSIIRPDLIKEGGRLYIPINGASYLDIFNSSPLAIKCYTGKEIKFTRKNRNPKTVAFSHETTIYSGCVAGNLVKCNLIDFNISIVNKDIGYNLDYKIKKNADQTTREIALIIHSLNLEPTITHDSKGSLEFSFISKSGGNDLYDYEFSTGIKSGNLITGTLKIKSKTLVNTEYGAWQGSISLGIEVQIGGCTNKNIPEIILVKALAAVGAMALIVQMGFIVVNDALPGGQADNWALPIVFKQYIEVAKRVFVPIM